MTQSKIDDINQPAYTEQSVKNIPVHRCLVLMGHEFQNFPAEVSKILKIRQPTERNIVKWMLQGRRTAPAYNVMVQKHKQMPSN